jgi:hypothetical protein
LTRACHLHSSIFCCIWTYDKGRSRDIGEEPNSIAIRLI